MYILGINAFHADSSKNRLINQKKVSGIDSLLKKAFSSSGGKISAIFKDYDDLIPEEEWGLWDGVGEPDYMHFTGQGHKRLATAVYQDIQTWLNK